MYKAIIGGTFDPPHLAHLMAAETAYLQLGVDQVLMVPAGSPWQKADEQVSAGAHRWEMTRLATQSSNYIAPDDREVRRDGWTYTADTLDGFSVDDRVVLILGADAAANMTTWHRYDEIRERAEIAVAPRLGTTIEEVDVAIGSVIWLDMPLLEISGTSIRDRARNSQSFRYLVPDAVYQYIVANGLYDQ